MAKCILLLWSSLLITGCNLLEFPAYALFAPSSQKVKAEYKDLKNKTIALVVVTDSSTDFMYPQATDNITRSTAEMIRRHVKDIEFIDQIKIKSFQDDHQDWAALPMSEIMRKLDTQTILLLDLFLFSTKEENSVHLLRGQIAAAVSVYQINSPTPDKPAYQTEIEVIYPETGPLPESLDAHQKIYKHSLALFTRKLFQKFYDQKVPVK